MTQNSRPARKSVILLLLSINFIYCTGSEEVSVSDPDLLLTAGTHVTLQVYNNGADCQINFTVDHEDLVKVIPSSFFLSKNQTIIIQAIAAGHTDIIASTDKDSINVDNAYIRVTVYNIPELDTFSIVIGWIYFVTWSVSFFPQIYINFRRKSVVGLNFDMVAFNLIGFTLYSLFNLCLFFSQEIKDEYQERFPRSVNPIQVNDIVFALLALLCTIIMIYQIYVYERGDQKVSWTATGIMCVFGVFLFISVIIAATGVIDWLEFLYYCSYVKLATTLIKYAPQTYLNYKRKSTDGFSIYAILCDFIGGTTSMLQMLINGYNYDDWVSIFGDPTKFGLGLFSVIFDIIMMFQHFVLYRNHAAPEKS